MSVGDLHVERTGEFAVTRVRRRARQATVDPRHGAAIAVLTEDAALADAIHDAAAPDHPVAVASTFDEALELAATGRCGILITDRLSTHDSLRRMTQQLRDAEPALVVIAVGGAGDQNGLIKLLSAGLVDRLMLKPITHSLAQIVLRSAVQQHRTLQSAGTVATPIEPERTLVRPATSLVEMPAPADTPKAQPDAQISSTEIVVPAEATTAAAASPRFHLSRPIWLPAAAIVLAVIALIGWVALERKPSIDQQALIASTLASAERAFLEGHILEPSGRSALDHYTKVLTLDPANAAARRGIERIAEHRRLQALQAQTPPANPVQASESPETRAPKPEPVTTLPPALQQKVEAQARAVAEAAEALKRDRLELASVQEQFAARIEAAEAELVATRKELAEARLAAVRKEQAITPPPAPAPEPAIAEPEVPKPRLVHIVRPEYPHEARRDGEEGWVNVSMSVTPAGDVLDPRVEGSSNGALFNRAALAAVRKWKYEPYAARDPNETRRVTVRVEFRMEER